MCPPSINRRPLADSDHSYAEPLTDYSNLDTLLKGAPQWWLEHIMKFSIEDFAKPD